MSLRDQMLAVIAEVNSQVAEREELIELIAVALLTRNNLFILGKPGQAKSHSINLFRQRITGARQFERLLSKQTDEDQLFGRIDLSSLIPGSIPESALEGDAVYENLRSRLEFTVKQFGHLSDTQQSYDTLQNHTEKLNSYRNAVAALHQSEPMVNTAGKIPEADICFLDEIFKCNDGVLNSLLTALNERKYTNEGRTYAIPTISFFAASNEIPNFNDPQENILEALYDRLQIKVVTQDIADRSKRLGVLKDKQSGAAGAVRATITLDELVAMQSEVAAIPVPDAINELADDILCELRRNGVTVSDRKYLNFYPLAQAKAWLEGHDKVMPKDLLILKCYLWQQPGDRAIVESALNRLCVNPLQDKVSNVRAMALEAQEEFDAARNDAEKPTAASKSLIKLRGELIRLYRMQQELSASAQSDAEQSMTAQLLDNLEQISKRAHEAAGFTYAPLEQLAALQ
jgi:MoxR-like ATPase